MLSPPSLHFGTQNLSLASFSLSLYLEDAGLLLLIVAGVGAVYKKPV